MNAHTLLGSISTQQTCSKSCLFQTHPSFAGNMLRALQLQNPGLTSLECQTHLSYILRFQVAAIIRERP